MKSKMASGSEQLKTTVSSRSKKQAHHPCFSIFNKMERGKYQTLKYIYHQQLEHLVKKKPLKVTLMK